MDALVLSRLQFALTLSYHILFPTLTIGLAWFLVILEGLWLKTGEERYKTYAKFWAKIFALAFGMGVVSGIVLSYEFGTNFSRFSAFAGDIIGPLMGYEVMSAFFLEAGFLGILLFGWNRVGPRLHFFATLMVAAGTLASAFWILAANSWMQTPTGHLIENGRAVVGDWWAIVFNPSFPYRLSHMLTASFLTGAFFVLGVGAWHARKGRDMAFACTHLKLGLAMAIVLAPLQILIGDLHGLIVREHQPVKVAAMEGLWETTRGAPMLLFAIPDAKAEENRFEVKIPRLASLILTHDAHGEVQGLKSVPASDRPPIGIVFWSFRVMVGLGMLMLLTAGLGTWLYWRGRLEKSPRYLRLATWMTPAGFVATLAGWYVAEVGRQPWVVYGLQRTADAVSPIPAGQVLHTLSLFVAVYSLLFAVFTFYLVRLIRRGPANAAPDVPNLSGRLATTEV